MYDSANQHESSSTERTTGGSMLRRFVRALGRNPDQPVHRWPVWAPLIMAVALTYATYFSYGVFIANTEAGAPKAEARLMVNSCSPNWFVLGLRAHCAGTIMTADGRIVQYETQFSRFGEDDVGRSVPVHDSYEGFLGRVWTPVQAADPASVAKLALGPLFIGAAGFWYLFVARTVVRGFALAVRGIRRA